MTPSQWREIWIGMAVAGCINIVLFLIPGYMWFVWALQLIYIVPASIILPFFKKYHLVGALWIIGGATFILDVAFCGLGVRL